MKIHKLLLITAVIFSVTQARAESKTIESIVCKGKKYDSEVRIHINKLELDENGQAEITYMMSLLHEGELGYGFIPDFDAGIITGKQRPNVPYNGKKYPNHLKFPLTEKGSEISKGYSIEYANLIISPAHTVVKSIPEQNHWDKNWTWTVEVRKYSAALDVSFNDHHGDYIQLNCYSTKTVDEKRP